MPIDREKVLQAAQKHVERKRFDRAIIEYQKIVQEDPNDARTLLKIGDLQARMQSFEAAIGTYERVARHYGSQGFSVKAIAVYKQIREIIRKHVPQLSEQYGHTIPKLAQLYQDLGLTGDALSAYDEYAAHLQRAGRDREAIDIFHKIVEINGNNPLTRLRLAEALLRQQEVEEALNQFLIASDILLGMGRTDDALKVIERMIYQKPDPALARRAAEIYLERGHDEDGMLALAKLQICFQADHRDLKTLLLLARAFEAIGQAPKATEVRKELARIARDQGEFEIAKEAARALLAEAPQDDVVQSLARSILAAERASVMPGARSEPPAPVKPRQAATEPDAVIEVSEEFVDLGFEESIELSETSVELIESSSEFEVVPRLEVVTQPRESDSDFEELEPLDDTAVQKLPDQAPRSIREVVVSDGVEVAEDYGAQPFDPEAHAREVLAQARAFRSHQLYDKAIETLRMGLSFNPDAFDLHVTLKDLLLESGNHSDACDELVVIANIYIDAQDPHSGAQLLAEVLSIDPSHANARNLLTQLGYEVPNPVETSSPTTDYPSEPMTMVDAIPGFNPDYAGPSGIGHSESLPSYDLEEINPSYAMSSLPPSEEPADYGALLTADDPFASVDTSHSELRPAVDEPFAESGGAAPLPSFPLTEEGSAQQEHAGQDVAYDQGSNFPGQQPYVGEPYEGGPYAEPYAEQYAETYGEQHGEQQYYAQQQYVDPTYQPASDHYNSEHAADAAVYAQQAPVVDAGPGPLAGSRAFQGGDSLEDALEEAEFFASRGLFEDALAILEEQGQRFPNHPLLIERVREVRDATAAAASEAGVAHQEAQLEIIEDNAFDIAASLDVLDAGMLGERVEEPDGFGRAVDVEEVFAKFKEGVKSQVSESDSQTHYDLGVAYREMGLLNDSINEFSMAARDPKRECVCWSMIGIVQNDLGNPDAAIEAFIRGLHSENKLMEQELALYFELGNVYQMRNNPQEALYYFEKVIRRDPMFRDVAQRVRELQPETEPPRLRTAGGEDDFDRAFDDMFGDSKLSQG